VKVSFIREAYLWYYRVVLRLFRRFTVSFLGHFKIRVILPLLVYLYGHIYVGLGLPKRITQGTNYYVSSGFEADSFEILEVFSWLPRFVTLRRGQQNL